MGVNWCGAARKSSEKLITYSRSWRQEKSVSAEISFYIRKFTLAARCIHSLSYAAPFDKLMR